MLKRFMVWVIEWCQKMNRLWVRLSVSFLLVTWLVIVIVAAVMSYTIETSFGHFLNTSNSLRFGPNFVEELEAYYAENESWEGVSALFPQATGGQGNRQGAGQGQGAQIFIAKPDGTIVYASNEQWIDMNMSDIGASRTIDLIQNGQVIGLLGEQTPGTIALNQAETQFLQETAKGLLFTALGGGLVALAVAIILSRSLTSPLRNLAAKVGQMTSSNLGQPIHANGTLEISQLSAAFNDLSSRLAETEARRQRMSADIAHELRTPVTVMRGHVEAMMDGIYALDVQHLAVAYDQILHLARLVEDMRLLTKVEAGQLSLDKTKINPHELITRAAQRFQPLAEDAEIHLKVELEPDLPELELDVNRIQQALDNLIANALRHTAKEGMITLSSHLKNNKVIIRVHNTGNPIPLEYIDHLFDRFWRADEARERDMGGTGLGLAITKLLIELHGGHIVALPVSDGAAFEISLSHR